MRVLLACLILLCSAHGLAQSPLALNGERGLSAGPGINRGGPDFLPVEQAYQLDILPRNDGTLQLHWEIAEGYYLYRHALEFSLGETAPDGRSAPTSSGVPLSFDLPPGIASEDEFFGEVEIYYDELNLRLKPAATLDTGHLTVRYQGCADAGLCYPPQIQRFRVDFDAGSATLLTTPEPAGAAAPGAESPGPGTLPLMLLLAFAGGIILNLMPCVFPILSLKILSFASSDSGESTRHAWLYTAGVIASFLLVAAVLLALQGAGRAIGWGFQLQSPLFVVLLAWLFLVMGLSLSGMLQLGGRLMNAGSGLAARQGPAGSFFTGVLAVLVASPCTAPFMGTALGFAITQPAFVALLVFAALGAGMAAPLVLLSYSSTARRWMPRPGAWMESLKQFLAFPLYASAIWLLWVAGRQAGVDAMTAALAGGLLIALALWLWRDALWRRLLAVVVLALGLTVGLSGVSGQGGRPAAGLAEATHAAWSPEQVARLQQAGRPVFVDFTADWCITCLANERTVLETAPIQAAFAARNVAYLVADWTHENPAIADFLRQMGRSGIPLYLLYPGEPGAEPKVLPQLLSRGMVLDALQSLPEPAAGTAGTIPAR